MKAEAVAIRLVLGLLSFSCLAGCEPDRERSVAPAGQLRLGAVLGETGLAGFAVADSIRTFSFPADHGPHPGYRSEWWYLTFLLEDPSGSPVGVQFTLFRQALSPEVTPAESAPPTPGANRWRSEQVYLAHLAITDVASGEHLSAERFARGHPSLAGVSTAPFQLWLEDWRIDSDGGRWRLTAGTGEFEVDLTLNMNRPPVLQGDRGLSRKGPAQASYYYSVPGVEVSGRITVEGHSRVVSGQGWLDREWSTSVLGQAQTGWDWFALQLADGRNVMMFQLRRRDGSRDPYDQGLLLGVDGVSQSLGPADFTLTPADYWTDEQGTDWPIVWTVRLNQEVWRVRAVLADQLMDTSIRYWEGLVDVYDPAARLVGRGYLELTGYEGRKAINDG